jgi:hypothetical protein
MSELSREEKAFLDEAYERLKTTRRTFTEREALNAARLEGYELKLSFDKRFARAEARQGQILPHWRLAEQTLANTRLLNELKVGIWDGQNVDEKLHELDQEDQQYYTFYPHDPRMFLNRKGAWEASGERQITLPLGLKGELDTFIEGLHTRWIELNTPLTVGQVLAILEELGWRHDGLSSINRYIRAWLLATEQFRRVGEDYWIPAELLPPEIKRTRLQVLPIRVSAEEAVQHSLEGEQGVEFTQEEQERAHKREQIIFKGTATKSQVTWIATLLSIHLNEGFLPIPKAIRGIYPPLLPGEENISVLRGLWYDDADEIWIWLDRTHHRLYGPNLLDKIGFYSAGIKLKIDWNIDGLVLREEGHDEEVQKEETRLIDLEELKQLRGGIGEGYRQTIQTLLLAAPEGFTFKEIVIALRARQQHEVPRSTVRSILASGGFIQWRQRWYAAPDTRTGAKKLKEAQLETLVPQAPEGEQTVLSHQEYVRTRVAAIQKRLQEITRMLREDVRE